MVRPRGGPRRSAWPTVCMGSRPCGRASSAGPGPVREVAVLLEQYRLVTVTGPGGAGKTRLAGEVARRGAGRFADGVWLAELAMGGETGSVAAGAPGARVGPVGPRV